LGIFNIIGYCDRPFQTAEEMDETMIANWNSVVGKDDTVYHLGDFAFGKGSQEKIAEYVSRLNGYIVLIKGNHDRKTFSWYVKAGFYDIIGGEYWQYKPGVIFSHRPQPNKGQLNIHGHIHNLYHIHPNKLYINVSVEVINYTPVRLSDILKSI
jgi:calcineurin-like phosphoesterase family protein